MICFCILQHRLVNDTGGIAPDKDWRQLGIYPPLFGLIGYFKILNWVFQVFVLGIYLKANKK